MSDIETRIARAFADDAQAGDETFVRETMERVAAEERMRKIRLVVATLAAACLAAALCYGVSLAWKGSLMRGFVPAALPLAMPSIAIVISMFVSALLLPLIAARRSER